jgi:hypothetical protein
MDTHVTLVDNERYLLHRCFSVSQEELVHLDQAYIAELVELNKRQFTVREYYNLLEKAPWNYGDHDNYRDYIAGRVMISTLKEIAHKNDWIMLFLMYENYAIHPMDRRFHRKPDCPIEES